MDGGDACPQLGNDGSLTVLARSAGRLDAGTSGNDYSPLRHASSVLRCYTCACLCHGQLDVRSRVPMVSLYHLLVTNYNDLIAETIEDPLVDSWLLMGSIYPLLAILAAYLVFVLRLGPSLMRHRPAFSLKGILVAYNAYQVAFSLWLCTTLFRYGTLTYFVNNGCRPLDPSAFGSLARAVSDGAWWYFFSKVIELLDTVFFVLRKKQSQVSILHVYHHAATALFSWGYLKYLPGEQGVVIAFLNSLVHVVMYSYYLMSALGPQYNKYLWWKKYMTWIQLGQFCLMLTYLLTLLILDCKLPKALTLFLGGNCVIFLYLFAQFYKQAYHNKMAAIKHKNNKMAAIKHNGHTSGHAKKSD